MALGKLLPKGTSWSKLVWVTIMSETNACMTILLTEGIAPRCQHRHVCRMMRNRRPRETCS